MSKPIHEDLERRAIESLALLEEHKSNLLLRLTKDELHLSERLETNEWLRQVEAKIEFTKGILEGFREEEARVAKRCES